MRLQKVSISYEDVSDLALIEKVMEGGKNESEEGYKKKNIQIPLASRIRIRAITIASTAISMAIMLLDELRRRWVSKGKMLVWICLNKKHKIT